ncbi:MAG TPA: tRNA dihydrouridine synthase DusB [Anaerolineales bacterium]|nr:tRNA dihydrouridine synthase DusB [Anaerolineales bacterium]
MPPAFLIRHLPIYGDALLAPMSGYSDLPFRSICRELGSAMSYTEFVPAPGIIHGAPAVLRRLKFTPAERPITFQIFGPDEHTLAEAAKRIEPLGPDLIDVNMGCYADDVALHGAGAGLLCKPAAIGRIFAALTRALKVPVTGKIRLGWDADSRNYLEVARTLEDNGASLIAVHGRTKVQAYKGGADWDAIREVKAAVRIPVVGSGDVKTPADIDRMKRHTGVDAVMIGRAAIGNPWIFARRERRDVPFPEVAAMIRKHLARALEFYGPADGFNLFRRHAHKYIFAVPLADSLRASLANARAPEEVLETISNYEAGMMAIA